MDSYPILNFLVLHGRKLAAALALATVALGIFVSLEAGMWVWTLFGIVGGAIVYTFVASYAELVRLVTDMLLPK